MTAAIAETKGSLTMGLELRPITLRAAREHVANWHRHNLPPQGGLFAVAVADNDQIVGVAIVGRPVARMLDDGYTAEVTRVATTGAHNACSMLYGAACRAAKSLGYRRIYTYTLQSEPGTSLRASGWSHDADLRARNTWDTPTRQRQQVDLFGNDRRPTEPKTRWTKELR
jgi:hypothetical protein